MPSNELLQRAARAWDDYLALGNEVRDEPDLRLVRAAHAPRVYDANYASRVRASTAQAIESVLARIERGMAGLAHRRVLCDPLTPAPFEARLQLEGYELDTELEMLLEGELSGSRRSAAGAEIRLVEDEADWKSVAALFDLDVAETARKEARDVYPRDVVDGLLAQRRAKAPALRTWLARVDGSDCGYFSSWPGNEGVGKVEDLFTHPEFRHRGVASALIAHAVDDARARGAAPVMIGARGDDTPKRMYAALGFLPAWVQRSWRKLA